VDPPQKIIPKYALKKEDKDKFKAYPLPGTEEQTQMLYGYDQCAFCWLNTQVQDPKTNEVLYNVSGCPCQIGLCFPWIGICFPKCADVQFDIIRMPAGTAAAQNANGGMGNVAMPDANAIGKNPNEDKGEVVGRMMKKWYGICDLICDINKYHIYFPDGASQEVKAQIFGVCMLIDKSYFGTGKDRNQNDTTEM